ncbi:hypothetical protein M9Y10_032107 [Tritrichomonas musculus]|uniref:Uncharacterized protein n=1 Tax=Tritrichomonas musculus TaxID=1915356 RepID=A0ABR2H0Z1_9EUKA
MALNSGFSHNIFPQDLIKFNDINQCTNDSTQDINLLDHQSFNPFSFLIKDFTINMQNGSYKFNSYMIKGSSSEPKLFDTKEISLIMED